MTDKEREQLRKMVAFQKVAGVILWKKIRLLSIFFVCLTVGFSLFLIHHYARSVHRFDASTRLLYSPRQISRIPNMSDKQLLSVLDRASIKRKVGSRIQMDENEKRCLVVDLEIKQERHPSNLFTLTAHAPSWRGVVQKVNTYAEMLIEGYVEYRMRDLDNWKESLEVRKKTLQAQISNLESEENVLKGKAGVATPVETLTMTTGLLSDQRRNMSLLDVQIANEELKRKKLEKLLGPAGAAFSSNAATIRRKSDKIAAIDGEIAKLREIYTDKNPKVSGKLEERKELLDDYVAFLKTKGIDGVDLETIDQVEKSASELSETVLRIDGLRENLRSLEQEIKSNEKRAAELTAIIPAFDRLRVKRADLDQTVRDLDDQLENIAYLQMSIRNDLQQIERAGGAGDKNPFRPKTFIIAIGGASVCTFVLALWLLAVELLSGKVTGGKELRADDSIEFLGSLPKPDAMDEADERDVLGVVALKFAGTDLPRGVVLVCRLPGADVQPKFRNALDWSLSMAGARSFTLEVVCNANFTPPDGAVAMLNTSCKGDYGWFPVENRYTFAPTELQMLQADIASLRESYDHVFIHMPDGIRRGGSFFDQVVGICDSALLVVGADSTPRSWLAYAKRHVQMAAKPMMGLVVNAAGKVVRMEMEAKR